MLECCKRSVDVLVSIVPFGSESCSLGGSKLSRVLLVKHEGRTVAMYIAE